MSRKSSRRAAAVVAEPPPAPRPRRGAAATDIKQEDGADGMTADEVAELWAQFAADHYEIVEQLPLELHRNSRLLRELDSESLSQQTRLQSKIREYVAYRIAVARPQADTGKSGTEVPPSRSSRTPMQATPVASGSRPPELAQPAASEPPEVKPRVSPENDQMSSEKAGAMTYAEPNDRPLPDHSTADATAAVSQSSVRGTPATNAAEAPPVEEHDEHDAEAAVELELGAPDVRVPEPQRVATPASRARSKGRSVSAAPTSTPAPSGIPKRVNLGEISSLVSELVRNREEKVAIAVGAYNTIDRHIRALDSALSAQETSLLGLAPSAEPQPEPVPEEAEAAARRGRKDKRKRKDRTSTAAEAVPTAIGELPPGIEADPNEPRYCYCNQVSYGEMVGCDNDDCPMEWFHLSCLGLTAPPAGEFLCDVCKAAKEGGGGGGSAQKKRRRR